MEKELADMKATTETLQEERDFYFGKLRFVEIECQSFQEDSGITAVQIVKKIESILYAAEHPDSALLVGGDGDGVEENDDVVVAVGDDGGYNYGNVNGNGDHGAGMLAELEDNGFIDLELEDEPHSELLIL